MKSSCVGVLSIIELKNARWNIEILRWYFCIICMFLVTCFISLCFKEIFVLAPWERRDNSAEKFRSYVNFRHKLQNSAFVGVTWVIYYAINFLATFVSTYCSLVKPLFEVRCLSSIRRYEINKINVSPCQVTSRFFHHSETTLRRIGGRVAVGDILDNLEKEKTSLGVPRS